MTITDEVLQMQRDLNSLRDDNARLNMCLESAVGALQEWEAEAVQLRMINQTIVKGSDMLRAEIADLQEAIIRMNGERQAQTERMEQEIKRLLGIAKASGRVVDVFV